MGHQRHLQPYQEVRHQEPQDTNDQAGSQPFAEGQRRFAALLKQSCRNHVGGRADERGIAHDRAAHEHRPPQRRGPEPHRRRPPRWGAALAQPNFQPELPRVVLLRVVANR